MECVHNRLVPSTAFEAAGNPAWYGPSLSDLNSHFIGLIKSNTIISLVDFSGLANDTVNFYKNLFGNIPFKAPVDDRQDQHKKYGDLTLVYVEAGIVKINYRDIDGQNSIVFWSDRAESCG